MKREWTDAELFYLLDSAERLTMGQMGQALNRSRGAVAGKLRVLRAEYWVIP